MNDTTIMVLVTIAVSAAAAIWAVLKWNSRRSSNFLLRGTGIVLMAVGAALVGLTGQIIEWLRHLSLLTTTISVGIAVAVLGLLAYVVGGLIKVPTKDEAKLREYERQAKQRENDAKQMADVQRKQAKVKKPGDAGLPTAKPETSAKQGADAEVDNILHKHGIE